MLAVCHFHQRCIATSTSLLSNGSSIHQGSSSASSFVRSIASVTSHFWFCIHHQLVVWADFSPDQPGRRRPPVGLPPAGERKPSSHHRGDLQYIRDFDRLVQTTTTARDLYDQMLQLHPLRMNVKHDWIRTSDLFAFMFCLPGRALETKLPKRVASDRMAMAQDTGVLWRARASRHARSLPAAKWTLENGSVPWLRHECELPRDSSGTHGPRSSSR